VVIKRSKRNQPSASQPDWVSGKEDRAVDLGGIVVNDLGPEHRAV
jgi:hypothetical protein